MMVRDSPWPDWLLQEPCRGRTSCRCVPPWSRGCPPSGRHTSTPAGTHELASEDRRGQSCSSCCCNVCITAHGEYLMSRRGKKKMDEDETCENKEWEDVRKTKTERALRLGCKGGGSGRMPEAEGQGWTVSCLQRVGRVVVWVKNPSRDGWKMEGKNAAD